MLTTDYKARYSHYIAQLDERLTANGRSLFEPDSAVAVAALYSLMAGGKRVRGVLTCAVADLLGSGEQTAVAFGAALEMLHCYSLIHDDLPCMDDADTRRGQTACHKKFGEATALLAGDALLTASFDALAQSGGTDAQISAATGCLARAAGPRGMVYGQELDLAFEHRSPDRTQLLQIHANKTGALIDAAVYLGVIAAGGDEKDAAVLGGYSHKLGLAFQIMDDVLDVTATESELGKPIGSDAGNGKVTFATLCGVEKALQEAMSLTEEGCSSLQERYGEKADFLVALAKSLAQRKK